MSMKLSRKFFIGAVIDFPKYFASHFGHVTLKQRLYPLLKNGEHLYFKILKTFGINLTRLVQLCLSNAAF